ncbi:MAG: IS3 family transposase [Paracoccaceae bacterium]
MDQANLDSASQAGETPLTPEVRARAVRTVPEHQADRPSQWAAISSIAGKFGCTAETLRKRVRQAERDAGERPGLTSDECARLKALERENRELRQADGILRKASASFAWAELDRRSRKRGCPSTRIVMNTGSSRSAGSCRSPSTYRAHAGRMADPALPSNRAKRDDGLRLEIRRVWRETFEVHGARKVWRQPSREGIAAARCTVERLRAEMGLAGAVRGRPVKTTRPDTAASCPRDRVNRQFHASRPNALRLSDFTYVATWSGFVYVAFVIDAFARRIAGWRASRSMAAGLVLDALEQALHDRRPAENDGPVHHSDRGSQYVSIEYTERLAEAGIEPSIGSIGDSYDNALAEKLIGLFKTEVIRRRGPWRGLDAVEFATLERVDWFDNRRLLEPIGNIPPAEAEQRCHAQNEDAAVPA